MNGHNDPARFVTADCIRAAAVQPEQPTVRQALTAFQLSDSFFPSGMFAHSLGLEPLVRRGRVRTIADVQELLTTSLCLAVIPSDGLALLHAHRAVRGARLDTLMQIDQRLHLLKVAPEPRQASRQHGRRVLDEAAAFCTHDTLTGYREAVRARHAPGCGAVALGAVQAALDVPEELALAGYLHGYCAGLASAAIRLIPLSNTECQAMLHRLHAVIDERVESISELPWTAMTSVTPELDIASMEHARDEIRMFAS